MGRKDNKNYPTNQVNYNSNPHPRLLISDEIQPDSWIQPSPLPLSMPSGS